MVSSKPCLAVQSAVSAAQCGAAQSVRGASHHGLLDALERNFSIPRITWPAGKYLAAPAPFPRGDSLWAAAAVPGARDALGPP